jgi:hypothetical protein
MSQERFEIHMMGCSECLNDVESWRVIKTHMPDAVVIEAARQFKKPWWGGWGMAASFGGAVVAAVGGWYANALQQPNLDSSEIAIFDMQPVTRSSDCYQLPVAANTSSVVLRITRVDSERHPVATDMDGRELSSDRYNARVQRDGSWVLRFDSDSLQNTPAYIVARKSAGDDESLGCVTTAVAPPPAS